MKRQWLEQLAGVEAKPILHLQPKPHQTAAPMDEAVGVARIFLKDGSYKAYVSNLNWEC
jgi:hypothetical protein